jgi:hypothetical protein
LIVWARRVDKQESLRGKLFTITLSDPTASPHMNS